MKTQSVGSVQACWSNDSDNDILVLTWIIVKLKNIHVGTCISDVFTCYMHNVYVLVGSCLATKVFIGNLPSMGRGWVIIK